MGNLESYYWYILREKLDFRYRLYQLSKIANLDDALFVAQNLIEKAVEGSVGYLGSSELEKPFLELAQTIETPHDVSYLPNSFLHVMTTSYVSGGHTRVVERWIKSSPIEQIHSVALLEQKETSSLKELNRCVEERHGNLIIINEIDIKRKAQQLRNLGCKFEYIVLHVHMWDTTPIVAFGSNEFKRPVIFFNHADNLFWCCSSIVDMLADIRDNDFAGIRGIKNVHVLRIPFEISFGEIFRNRSKEQSRKNVGLPMDKIIILTVGSSQKFESFDGRDFCTLMNDAIAEFTNVICVGVGPDERTGSWNLDKEKFLPVGAVKYGDDYFDYLNACDIYVDSIPIGGGTAKLDAIQFHKPVLSYSFFKQPFGEIVMGVDSINDYNQFVTLLRKLITDAPFRVDFAEEEYRVANNFHGVDVWRRNLEQMISKISKEHHVNNIFFSGRKKIDEIDVMNVFWWRQRLQKKINMFDVLHQIRCLGYKG